MRSRRASHPLSCARRICTRASSACTHPHRLQLVAIDAAGSSAVAERVIAVVSGCTAEQYVCGTACRNAPCDAHDAVAELRGREALEARPTIALHVVNTEGGAGWPGMDLTLVYGRPAALSLLPCPAAADAAAGRCVASAADLQEGDLSGVALGGLWGKEGEGGGQHCRGLGGQLCLGAWEGRPLPPAWGG